MSHGINTNNKIVMLQLFQVTSIMLALLLFMAITRWATAGFDPELHEKFMTMPKSAFVEYFNQQNYSWKITEYNHIHEEYAACEHDFIGPIEEIPFISHEIETLPTNFDARQKWAHCESIRDIYNQGACGSCWTFGCATTASDRTCIHKKAHVRLAEQDFECMQKGVCGGGLSYNAFLFWRDQGLVTQDCKPYDIEKLLQPHCETKCVGENLNYTKDKHFAASVYRVPNEVDQIKAELVANGPIQASYPVYADFFDYKSGVYIHSYGDLKGYHSVRVIGYGVENGMEYWLAANSWGEWGEHGLFKIKSYQTDVNFEEQMITGIPMI
ncbi:hypothetical protein HF086_002803 [Spodoptera exigua]|uniref:Peptidase C1A papain C-terminal domain-containing protein n=1 Tax=Spodoptera exigua TaxID=7107 RepID=A0A922M9C9_SPOEX|nr:hypothetical protein HF086_002803 [Spodoptera exigua]